MDRSQNPIRAEIGGPGAPPFAGMVWVPGGTFLMGCDGFYPEERPVHRIAVDGYRLIARPVASAEFGRFARATGHPAVAERPPDPRNDPGIAPALLLPGSLVLHRRPPSIPSGIRP